MKITPVIFQFMIDKNSNKMVNSTKHLLIWNNLKYLYFIGGDFL